jgi:CBS domain-containing protein
MTLNPITITADSPLADLGWSLLEERVGAVPVVDDDDRLIGIVSYVDVLRHALREG